MDYEFDPAKHVANAAKHGIGFDTAAGVFDGPVLTTADSRRDYGEARMRAIGMSAGLVLVVVYTDRGTRRRIISARRANRKEAQSWRSFVTLQSN